MTEKRSGTQRAGDNVAAFKAYWAGIRAKGQYLPLKRDGAVNLSQVAKESGIKDRGRLYTNEALSALVEQACKETLAASVPTPTPSNEASRQDTPEPSSPSAVQRLERRLNRLEQQNAVLMAENAELRMRVKGLSMQVARDELMQQSGRRIPAGPAA